MSAFNHIKSLFKDTSVLTAAVILQKSIGFIMLPIYAHYLRGEGYGIIGMVSVLISMMTVFIGYGMKGGIQRFYFLEESKLDKHRIVSTGIIVLIVLSVAISLPALLGSKLLSWLLFGKLEYYPYVILGAVIFIAEMTAQGGEAYFLIAKQTYLFAFLSLTRFIISLGLNIYLVVYQQMGVLGALYSNLISSLIFSLTLNLISLMRVGLHFERGAAKNFIKWNFPMVPGYIAMFFRNNIDKIILRSFLGVEFLGVYMMLLKFSSLIAMFITGPFLKVWSVKRLEICDQEDGPGILAKVFNLQTSLVLFFGLVLAIQIPYILILLTPEEFWVPNYYALLAVLPPIMMSTYYHFSFGITYSRLTYKFSIIHFITALISCLANYMFIKQFGLLGALIASVIVLTNQLIVTHLFSRKLYFIPFTWSKITSMCIGTFVLFFLIDAVSIRHFDIMIYIDTNVKPILMTWFKASNLEANRIGNILFHLIDNFEMAIEAVFKFCLSFTYLLFLYFLGIIPQQRIRELIRFGFKKRAPSP
jgi:O-antigen/teichoic acid export membrane protein